MHILYFHQHFSAPTGSVGIRSYAMARQLVDEGHQVTMVCGSYEGGNTGLTQPFQRGRRDGVVDGINVIEFNLAYSNAASFLKRTYLFLLFALRSIWVALRLHYDIVFATTTPLTAGIPGIVARWLRHKPFVFEVRDLWPELPKAMGVITNPVVLALMSVLEWVSYRSAHRLIGLSPGIVEGITARGVPPERIALVPNGCDLSLFSQPAEPWRPEGVAATDLMAVFCGTHGVANGLDAILDAANVLKSCQCITVKIVLIGQGKLKPALMQRAQREGLDNIVFHDPVNKTRLAGLLAATDIGLQTLANVPAFYYGTSPNKFFDYLSAGLPVLNNYPGWLADLIHKYHCGYAIAPDNPQQFAETLIRACQQKDALKVLGNNGLALAKQQFDRQQLAKQWAQWVLAST